MRGAVWAAVVGLSISTALHAETESLLAGVGTADITPPLEVGLLMSSSRQLWAPFEGVRLPLQARALVIEKGGIRIALVSLDLIGLAGEALGGNDAKRRNVQAQNARKCANGGKFNDFGENGQSRGKCPARRSCQNRCPSSLREFRRFHPRELRTRNLLQGVIRLRRAG